LYTQEDLNEELEKLDQESDDHSSHDSCIEKEDDTEIIQCKNVKKCQKSLKKVTKKWDKCEEKRPELVEDFSNFLNVNFDVPACSGDNKWKDCFKVLKKTEVYK